MPTAKAQGTPGISKITIGSSQKRKMLRISNSENSVLLLLICFGNFRLFGRGGRMAGVVKTTQAAAVLALSAAVGEARSAMLALLQRESSSTPAGMTDARALAMGALAIGFGHNERTPWQPDAFYTWQCGQ
jgi:hypothetical protein